jgi:hypothetical protein
MKSSWRGVVEDDHQETTSSIYEIELFLVGPRIRQSERQTADLSFYLYWPISCGFGFRCLFQTAWFSIFGSNTKIPRRVIKTSVHIFHNVNVYITDYLFRPTKFIHWQHREPLQYKCTDNIKYFDYI